MNTGIIFDLDGTLWNATENIAKSWNIVLKEKNIPLQLSTEELKGQMGKLMEAIADDLLPNIKLPERYQILQDCCNFENDYLKIHGGVLYKDVEEVFKQLADKYKLFIVSNCQKGYIETFLEFNGFGKYITDIEDAGNTGMPKDKNIRMVIERNKLDKAFYVGDTQGDLNACNKADVPFIHAAYGFGTIDEELPFINSINDLPKLLENLTDKDNK